jgi:hypothetical protein
MPFPEIDKVHAQRVQRFAIFFLLEPAQNDSVVSILEVMRQQVDGASPPPGPCIHQPECKRSYCRVFYLGKGLNRGESNPLIFNICQNHERMADYYLRMPVEEIGLFAFAALPKLELIG